MDYDRGKLVAEILKALEGDERPGPEWLTVKEIVEEAGKLGKVLDLNNIRKRLPDLVERGLMERAKVGGAFYYRTKSDE